MNVHSAPMLLLATLALVGPAFAATLAPPVDRPIQLSDVTVRDAYTDPAGTTWFATVEGVLARDARGGWDLVDTYELPGPPTKLVPGAGGILWVGTSGGLVGIDTKTRAFVPGPDDEQARKDTYSVLPMPDGTVWATFSSIITFRRAVDGTWARHPGNLAIFQLDATGETTWGASAQSLYRLEGEKWIDTRTAIRSHSYSVVRAADGAIWAAGADGAVRVPVEGEVVKIKMALSGIERTSDGTVWLRGKGRITRVDGAKLVERVLPGEHAGAAVKRVWRGRDALWVATEAGVVLLPDRGEPREVLTVDGPLVNRGVHVARYPDVDGGWWLTTNNAVYAVGPDGAVLQTLPTALDRTPTEVVRLFPAPGGATWAVDSHGMGPYDPARRQIDRLTDLTATPSFAPDGAAWWPRPGGGLVRIDPATRARSALLFEGRARALDARRDRVRVVGAIDGSIASDWDPKRGVWTPVAGLDTRVMSALAVATDNPAVGPDGTRWWPTEQGVVRESPEGVWTLLTPPKEVGRMGRVLVLGDTVLVVSEGLWVLDPAGTYTRVEAFRTRRVESVVTCGPALWVQSERVLFRGDATTRTWTQLDVDARPAGCTADGVLRLKGRSYGQLNADGTVEWERARVPEGQAGITAVVATRPGPPGLWSPPDMAWLSTSHGLRLFDAVTGAVTRLGAPLPGATDAVLDPSGVLWRTGLEVVERLDPRTGLSQRFGIPTTRSDWRLELEALADGTIYASSSADGRFWKPRDATAFAKAPTDGATPKVFVEGKVRFVTPSKGGGQWVGTDTGLVRADASGVVERFDHVPVGQPQQVFEDAQGRVWVVGTHGLAVRGPDGAWTRGGRPWQNGRAAPCPVPMERQVEGRWEPTDIVPQNVHNERFRPDRAGRIEIQLDSVTFRVAETDWETLNEQWLAKAGWAKDSPWGSGLNEMWEEADGGLRILTWGNAMGSSPSIYALDAGLDPVAEGTWRKINDRKDPAAGANFIERLPRPGGGAWLRRKNGWMTELGPDASILRHVSPELLVAPVGAVGVTPAGALVATSDRVAAAAVGGTWRGRPLVVDAPIAVAVGARAGGLLTRDGWVVDLTAKKDPGEWSVPLQWAVDLVAVGTRLCAFGAGAACLEPRTGRWAPLGTGGVFLDADADSGLSSSDGIWAVGLGGPVADATPAPTRGGAVCHYAGAWRCVDLPAPGRAVVADGSGGAWVGTTRGLYHLEPDGKLVATPIGAAVTHLARGASLYVGTESGLLAWRPGTATAQELAPASEGRVIGLAAAGGAAWVRIGDRIRKIEE